MTTTKHLRGYNDLTKFERDTLHRQRQIIELGSRAHKVETKYPDYRRMAERRWIKVDDDGTLRAKIRGSFVAVRPSRVTLPGGQTYLTFTLEEPDGRTQEPKT